MRFIQLNEINPIEAFSCEKFSITLPSEISTLHGGACHLIIPPDHSPAHAKGITCQKQPSSNSNLGNYNQKQLITFYSVDISDGKVILNFSQENAFIVCIVNIYIFSHSVP